MWNVFEHFRFVKSLFDFSNDTVRECGVLGIVFSLLVNMVSAITGMFNYFALEVLGVSIFFITMIFIVMLIDLVSGLAASKREGEKRESKKGLRWVFKLGSYMVFIYVSNAFSLEASTNGFEWLAYPLNVIKLYVVFHIVFWEMKSIDENLKRLGYSFQIFQLFNLLFISIRRMFKYKIGVDDNEQNSRKER